MIMDMKLNYRGKKKCGKTEAERLDLWMTELPIGEHESSKMFE